MSSSKKIFSGIIWSIIANIVNALYGFIMIPILINYFGKSEYGLIGLAQSVNAYMQIMDLGLGSTNVRFFSNWLANGYKGKVNKLFSTCTLFYGVIGVLNAIILIGVYYYSDCIFNFTEVQNVIFKKLILILAVAAIVNWSTACFNQIIQATENVAWTQKRIILTKLLMIIVLFITTYFDLSITLFFLLTILSNWAILPLAINKIREVAPFITFRFTFNYSIFKDIFPYTINIFSFTIFSYSYNNLKSVFLGMQSTPESVTDYNIMMGIVGLISSVTGIFLSALLPTSSKVIAKDDHEGYEMIAYKGSKYLMLFLGFCVFGMMSVDQDLISIYVGESFLYLIPWLNILLLTLLGNHIQAISSLILAGANIKPLSKMTAFSSLLALFIAWILIPHYSVGGVVIATITYTISQLLFYYCYYLKKIMNIDAKYLLFKIVIPVVIVGSLIVYLINNKPYIINHWINLLVNSLLFTILYLIFSLQYLNSNEKSFIKQLLLTKNKK